MLRSWSRPILFLLVTAAIPATAALRLELDHTGLTATQRQASRQLLDDAVNHLPPLLRERLDRRIQVQWRDTFDNNGIGRAHGRERILLNRHYLLTMERNISLPGRTHASVRQELLATVLHELVHLYDRGGFRQPSETQRIRRCTRLAQQTSAAGLPRECLGQTHRRFTFSDDPRLLDIAGWPQKAGQPERRERHNGFVLRSPDRYELTSPREFVAVNLEYFLLDPQYACRRPALYAYFRDHFQWAPAAPACPSTYAYLNAGRDYASAPLGELDPERIYQVDYLLAEANEQIASRWGHSMLRLVICAPGRPRGEACRLDLDQHLVLSYRAFIGDLQLSGWDGLTGAYPSRLFVLPLAQIIEEYTKLELRGLSSIPLRLEREEIVQLVQQLAQSHWAYDGKYYFISNNCAVETLNLLRRALPERHLDTLDSITPHGVLQLLDARGLVDRNVLQDSREALRLGYRFDSFRQRYQKMFDVLRQEMPVPQWQVEDWFAQPAIQRRQWIGRTTTRPAAAMLLLEQAALRRQLLLAQEELKHLYLAQQDKPASRQLQIAGKTLQQLLDESGFLSRPAELLSAGYGLPQQQELAGLQQDAEQRRQHLLHLSDNLERDVRALLSAQRRQELQESETNLQLIAAHLRQLHETGGGVQLP